jgi:phage regulator Rha-like protein
MPEPTMVRLENGGVIASTRDIAEVFGKQHKHVLAAVRAILVSAGSMAENSAMGQNQRVTSGVGPRWRPPYARG